MSIRQFIPPVSQPAYTFRPGTKIYLAGTSYAVEVYPTALRLYSCRSFEPEIVKEISFPGLGPLSGWVTFVDSMRQNVQIEGKANKGFVRYRIFSTEEGIFLKPATGMMNVAVNGIVMNVQKCEPLALADVRCSLPRYPSPRLLLGCNEAPNIDRIFETPTMEKVLPFWYQMADPTRNTMVAPSSTLFGSIVETIQKKERQLIGSAFVTFSRVALDGFFVPKRKDNLFLGYDMPVIPDEMLLTDLHPHICSMIRSLFLREEGSIIEILPCLPKELVAGRLLHETLLSGHHIDIEWRKGQIRRILLHATHDGVVTFKAHCTKAFLRPLLGNTRKRGVIIGEEIEVQEGKHYLLDNFSPL